jgi:hypothetical protein
MANRLQPIFSYQSAATARVHKLTVVTRNVADFKCFGVPMLNPFRQGPARNRLGACGP